MPTHPNASSCGLPVVTILALKNSVGYH